MAIKIMMDTLSKKDRSIRMGLVKNKDTKPEMIVRRLVHRMGYRYRLHDKSLPGKPDLVFQGKKKVVFVHGCFWHRHECRLGRIPKSRVDFWIRKLEANRLRDIANLAKLSNMGWQTLVIWECEIGESVLENKIKMFLNE